MFFRIVLASALVVKASASEHIQCLKPGIIQVGYQKTDTGNKYTFDGEDYSSTKKIGLKLGEYTFTGISPIHPLRFLDKSIVATDPQNIPKQLPSTIDIIGCTTGVDDLGYCVGDLTINVTGPVDGESYNCKAHGWMGGKNWLADCDFVVCTEEAKKCRDGTWVGRDTDNGCAFRPCPEGETRACCQATIASCLACQSESTVDEYCVVNPKTPGCCKPGQRVDESSGKCFEQDQDQACCKANTLACLHCVHDGWNEAQICATYPKVAGCPCIDMGLSRHLECLKGVTGTLLFKAKNCTELRSEYNAVSCCGVEETKECLELKYQFQADGCSCPS
tara:strand:- start:13153 stop:14154 length:1002 start_codon:yes stop_codon:yes gene_type:complete